MLSSAETIDVIAETLQAHKVPAIVLDPVNKNNAHDLTLPMLISVLGDGLNQWISTSPGESC